ncbi:MAG: restriction endonuclease subunit S [Muribaculaceae bacterium]|nr:restriction endonuclease subunit S [Muribaculaceae bacterium]
MVATTSYQKRAFIPKNRAINDNLEQQAQALYLSYFSDTPLCCLGDMVKTASGGTPSRNNLDYYSHSGIDWVKSKELNRSIIFQTEERITNNAINYSSAKVLPKYSTLIAMYGATVGEYGLIAEPMTCNQAICALIPNENYPYTYLFMFAKNVRQELINNAVGSAQQNISQVMIKNMQISSDLDSIKKFDDSVRGIFDSYIHLSKEISYLTELRDTLLPRLMSGELKIDEINC